MRRVEFSNLSQADLIVDAIYESGRKGNSSDDPFPSMLQVSNRGGFRYRGKFPDLTLLLITTNRIDPDWPDELDPETGVYTYFGDNKEPGRQLHDTPRKGNDILKRLFDLSHGGREGRANVPPTFIFEKADRYRDVRFLGLAVPGTANGDSGDLVTLWRTSQGARFENYRARFTILDCSTIKREWLADVISGNPHTPRAPAEWTRWVKTGQPKPLLAPRTVEHRTKAEQLPQSAGDAELVQCIHAHFSPEPHLFEHCAAALVRMMLPSVTSLDVTRPVRDGGRDAVGQMRIGSGPSSILVDFALEAKCYSFRSSVGVEDLSRLISRLRHRQFGVLVTTSYVGKQAYEEIKEDRHPIVIVAATDVVALLKRNGLTTPGAIKTWLSAEFPIA